MSLKKTRQCSLDWSLTHHSVHASLSVRIIPNPIYICVFNSVFDNTVLLVLNLDYKSKNMTGTHLKIFKNSRRIQGCKGQPMRIWQLYILHSPWWLWLSAPSSCPHVFPSIHPLYYTYPQWLDHIKTFLFFIICAASVTLNYVCIPSVSS